MKYIHGNFRAIAGILLLLIGYAWMLPNIERHTQAAPTSAPVTVVNTSANPVPTTLVGTSAVSGGVAITNTPTVNAQQSGVWNVGITGMPNVSLAPGGGVTVANTIDGSGNPVPLLIRDVDNPARNTFTTTCQALSPQSANNLGSCSLATIPAGKRFVVETTSGGCQAPSGSKLFQLSVGVFPSSILLLPEFTGPFNGTDNFVMNSSQRFYLDAGATPTFLFGSTDASGSTFCFVHLIGYLADIQ